MHLLFKGPPSSTQAEFRKIEGVDRYRHSYRYTRLWIHAYTFLLFYIYIESLTQNILI